MKDQDEDKENIIVFPEPSYFGDCPKCYTNDGYINIERAQWFVCHKHKVRWLYGENLFSGWRGETPEIWAKNWLEIGHYQVIDPVMRWHNNYPQRPMTEAELADIPF